MQKKRTTLFALLLVVTFASWSVAPAADGPEDILLFSETAGINNQGTIAGAGCTALCNTYEALRVRGETLDFLGTLGGYAAVAYDIGSLGGPTVARDINNRGVIVGSSRTPDGMTHAFVSERGVMTPLPGLGGTLTEAIGINNAGLVVGASTYPGSNRTRAVLWNRGTVVDLGTLGGASARAWKINARGDIVGRARTADGAEHAFLYRDGTMLDLGTLGGRNSAATDLNDHGEIVGVSETGDIDPVFGPITHGFVIGHTGGMRDLRSVIAAVQQ